jgi:hypothetical protein
MADNFATAADILDDQGEMYLQSGEWTDRLRERKLEINELGGQFMMLDEEMKIQQILTQMAQKEVRMLQRELDWDNFIADWQRATRTTNDTFYTWLQAEFHGIYYQTYTFAYDMAKKAEQALFMELGLPSMDSIIDFGCWDVSHNGLLAGEKLYHGLRKLEQAFSETRAYDFELTKKISLNDLDQTAYRTFTTTTPHVFEFWLPEDIFDLDFPGHYKRRILTVSIGFVADGRDLSAELTLLTHKYRVTSKETDAKMYPEKQNSDIALDPRFRQDGIPINAIGVTVSTKTVMQSVVRVPADSASGVFELNFGGDSYLPFEGVGVISKWRLELSPFTELEPSQITNMIMTIQYTSSWGLDTFKAAAIGYM